MPTQTDLQTRLARDLRRNLTDAERVLWHELRDREKMGASFRRQHPIDRYVVDFVCLKRRLVVEVDGGVHDDPHAQADDAARTAVLEQLGYRVVRFRNGEALADTDRVVREIQALVAALTPHPSPA